MSRGYKVHMPVSETDNTGIQVAMLPMLDSAQAMRDILVAELLDTGLWTREEGGECAEAMVTRDLGDGVRALLPVKVEHGTEVRIVAEASSENADIWDQWDQISEDKAQEMARDMEQERRARLREQAAKAIMDKEAGLRDEVDQAVQRTYVKALEAKARSMGTIESQNTTVAADGTIEVVVKIRC